MKSLRYFRCTKSIIELQQDHVAIDGTESIDGILDHAACFVISESLRRWLKHEYARSIDRSSGLRSTLLQLAQRKLSPGVAHLGTHVPAIQVDDASDNQLSNPAVSTPRRVRGRTR